MKAIKNIIGTAIGVTMITGFAALILALVLSLASGQFPALASIGDEVRCLAGLPKDGSACMMRKIAALDDQRRALEEERKRLGDVIAAQSFVFSKGETLRDGLSIAAGTLYEDAASQTGLIRSFCWVIVDNEGLDPRIGLAVMQSDGRIEEITPDPRRLAIIDMSARDADAARAACPFPRVT